MTPDDADGDGPARRHAAGGDHLSAGDALWDRLVCPYCRGPLGRRPRGAACLECGQRFPLTDDGTLDLRLQEPKVVTQSFAVGDPPTYPDPPFETGPGDPSPGFDLSTVPLPRRLPRDLAAHVPAAGAGALALDLGCGDGRHRAVCEAAGYRWVGVDVVPGGATLLGDGQALPFADDTFEFVLTLKVLAQVQNPFLALAEARRVLAPGGTLVGNVAATEPFFGSNRFNVTPLGLYEGLRQAGFETERVFPGWDAFTAQALMGRFPRLPRPLSRAAVAPLKAANRLWYRAGAAVSDHEKASEEFRRLNAAAELHFVAHVPERPRGDPPADAAEPTWEPDPERHGDAVGR